MATAPARVIELTLTPKFMGWLNWDANEAIRELIRNGIAAGGFRMDFVPSLSTIQLTNVGATIPAKALLAGYSSRSGGFGEGLKLAFLVLVQAGHRVTVFNGHEKWMPHIDRSDFFEEDVLKILVSPNATLADGVSIWIDGVDATHWKRAQEQRLILLSEEAGVA